MNTVLITGAARGIGLETAKQLLNKGYFVYLGLRDITKGEEIIKQLDVNEQQLAKCVEIDVTNVESISKAKTFIEEQSGKLDILINNAGISGQVPQTASSTPISAIQDTFETNFFGTIRVTQAFLSLLKISDNPRITNVTSGLSSLTLHDDPDWIFYAFKGASYGPSKTALNAYTQALAYELRDTAFKINVVDPGFTATDFNQHRGHGTVEDAASFIIQHTILDANGPTGKFFSNDIDNESKISPW